MVDKMLIFLNDKKFFYLSNFINFVINIGNSILFKFFIYFNRYQHIHIPNNNNYYFLYLKNLLIYKEA